MNSTKNSTLKKFIVPIYRATVWIAVHKHPEDLHTLVAKRLRMPPEQLEGLLEYDGLCVYGNGGFFLLFRGRPNINTMSHEVFHLTHRIMEWCECHFDEGHHEQASTLHGWLMEKIAPLTKPTYV